MVICDSLVVTCEAAPTCDAGLNADGAADVLDLLTLLSGWGACE